MDNGLIYHVHARWETGRGEVVTAQGAEPKIIFSLAAQCEVAKPLWTPEQLLLAAVASSYIVTFRAMADRLRVEFLGFQLSVQGKLAKQGERLAFTDIVLNPTLTIIRHADRKQADQLLEKAEHECLITRSLACPVLMEPLVLVSEEILAQ